MLHVEANLCAHASKSLCRGSARGNPHGNTKLIILACPLIVLSVGPHSYLGEGVLRTRGLTKEAKNNPKNW